MDKWPDLPYTHFPIILQCYNFNNQQAWQAVYNRYDGLFNGDIYSEISW